VAAADYGTSVCGTGDDFDCVLFETRLADRYAVVHIEDTAGGKVFATVSQNTSDGIGDGIIGQLCGETTEPIRLIKPGGRLYVSVFVGTCADGTPSAPSRGVVTVDFYRRTPISDR
jgi:hypothetical protein